MIKIKVGAKLAILSITLLIGISINNLSFSTYKQSFTAQQTITAAPWEVDSSVEYQNQTIDGQVFKGFKPGDVKENLIKLKNNNDYKTKFNLEIKTTGKLFENKNIYLTLNPVGILDTRKNITYDFYDIQQNNEGTIYYIEVELEPKTEKWIRLDIAWDENDENHKLYQGQIGEVVYTSRVEQVVD